MKRNVRRILITALRMAIGWHFIYEGLAKIWAGHWTASSFLLGTSGFLSGFYHALAHTPALLRLTDVLNMYGLLIMGLALFLGFWIRIASVSGFLLLALYYFAYPPFGPTSWSNADGNLFIVNKIFVEAVALLVFALIKDRGYGIDRLRRFLLRKNNKNKVATGNPVRREVLRNLVSLPLLGLFGWGALRQLQSQGADAVSGSTIQVKRFGPGELKGELPHGKLGKHNISRLVMGGNLIGGWSHARDLLYVSTLTKAYNTESKIFETLILAEEAGINTINIGFPSNAVMSRYKKATGSRIKVISQVHPNMEKKDYYESIRQAIDLGADILQLSGNWCDWLVRDKRLDVIDKMLTEIRRQNYTAGLGAHTVDSLIACNVNGIAPDYYMQTMHHDQYWSAHPRENRVAYEVDGERSADHNRFHDNLFCPFPDRTVEFISETKLPVMGFKVLAAGAIEPQDGFKWAFSQGADFICVGMFDFQIVENVNTVLDIFPKLERSRPWFS
jgi:uncharacterized membrane protein YphA (DoxX/SURF4 family)